MIDASNLSDRARDLATRIFHKLAEAEAHVHGSTIEKVHFHEVGAVDSIADIVGTAIALDALDVTRMSCEPVPTGQGTIQIAHGLTSIPAPATAELLRNIPLRPSNISFELTTPTGAAIVATLAESFGGPPAMSIEKIGCGAGDRDLAEQANVLRVLIGAPADAPTDCEFDQVCVMETNLDDSNGEVVGHCIGQLFDAGALDVFTTPIQMKKSRPGVLLSVLCRPNDQETMQRILFSETTTIGIRSTTATRTKLPRVPHEVQTQWGAVMGKLVTLPTGERRFSPEYDSCRQIALSTHQPVAKVIESAKAAYLSTP